MMFGAWIPGGMIRSTVCATELIWAMAPPTSAPGWKYTLIMPIPANDSDSMCSMPFTVVEKARSLSRTTRRSMSVVESPG